MSYMDKVEALAAQTEPAQSQPGLDTPKTKGKPKKPPPLPSSPLAADLSPASKKSGGKKKKDKDGLSTKAAARQEGLPLSSSRGERFRAAGSGGTKLKAPKSKKGKLKLGSLVEEASEEADGLLGTPEEEEELPADADDDVALPAAPPPLAPTMEEGGASEECAEEPAEDAAATEGAAPAASDSAAEGLASAAALLHLQQGFDEEGSIGGPYSEHKPPPGKAFGGFKKEVTQRADGSKDIAITGVTWHDAEILTGRSAWSDVDGLEEFVATPRGGFQAKDLAC